MERGVSRRQFLTNVSAGASAAALGLSAASYARVKGANDRISIGVIGCGVRGYGAHMTGVHKHDKAENVEITAVCDVWRVHRERAAARVKEWYGREARQCVSYRDLLGRANQMLAQRADKVYLMVAGIPLLIKPVKAR